MRSIIYVPGLNDDRFPQKYLHRMLPAIWKSFGYELQIVPMQWRNGRFAEKVERIIGAIEVKAKGGKQVVLIGQSAGASAVLNAYAERKKSVSHVINVCGRLRKGQQVFPSLDRAAGRNIAFKESVLLFERENEKRLTRDDRKKVLTLRPLMDETVPASTVLLMGATNRVLPSIEHSISGMVALTLFSPTIRQFLER